MLHVEIHGLSKAAAETLRSKILETLNWDVVAVTNIEDKSIDDTGTTRQFLRLYGESSDMLCILATSLEDFGLNIEMVKTTNRVPRKHFRYIL